MPIKPIPITIKSLILSFKYKLTKDKTSNKFANDCKFLPVSLSASFSFKHYTTKANKCKTI